MDDVRFGCTLMELPPILPEEPTSLFGRSLAKPLEQDRTSVLQPWVACRHVDGALAKLLSTEHSLNYNILLPGRFLSTAPPLSITVESGSGPSFLNLIQLLKRMR